MNHGSLFSGVGGFDLAAEWMGWENKFHCEISDFPRRILKGYGNAVVPKVVLQIFQVIEIMDQLLYKL